MEQHITKHGTSLKIVLWVDVGKTLTFPQLSKSFWRQRYLQGYDPWWIFQKLFSIMSAPANHIPDTPT